MSLTSRQDYLMRMIEQIIQVLLRVIGLTRTGDLDEALVQLRTGYGLLLGPFAEVVPRLDSASAAQIVANADQLLAYARLLHAEAEVRRLREEPAEAEALERRSLEFALEAHARGAADAEAADALIGTLAHTVGTDRLDPHFLRLLRAAGR
jgi:hypothetical protein